MNNFERQHTGQLRLRVKKPSPELELKDALLNGARLIQQECGENHLCTLYRLERFFYEKAQEVANDNIHILYKLRLRLNDDFQSELKVDKLAIIMPECGVIRVI